MTYITGNNATATLGSTLSAAATSLVVFTGNGARFPAVVAPDILMLTLDDGRVEIVKCTAHTANSDTFTVVRAAELYQTTGSLSYSYEVTGSGTLVEARLTKGMVENNEPIRLLQQLAPVTVAASSGTLQIYARGLAGKSMLQTMDQSALPQYVQSGLFESRVVMYKASWAPFPTGSGIGAVFTTRGTGSYINMAPAVTGGLVGTMPRLRLLTPAQSGSYEALRPFAPSGSGFCFRGTTAGQGGFFFHSRVFMPSGSSVGGRVMIGLSADTASVTQGGFGAVAQVSNSIFMGYMETGSTLLGGYSSLRVGMNGTSSGNGFTEILTTPTSHSDGNALLDVFMYAKPFDSQISIKVDKINSDFTRTELHSRAYTTNLPVASTLLSPHIEVQSNSANSASLEVISMYLETPN